jgi:16S rRNA (adenine1518-N6/adenine1519-N6)-dimethyltransferase
MTSARQTVSFLMQRFAEAGIRPHTNRGQNFLIDLNLQRLLVEAAQLGPDDVVLEVGTGTGSLTAMMAPLVAAVVSVEVDGDLVQMASEELVNFENVTLLTIDALKNKNRLNPAMLDALEAPLQAAAGRQFKLVANLPYNIATPIIGNLIALDRPPRQMTVTIQRELAERIIARPSTKDYSALSIWVQSQCRAQIVRILPPTVFWPRPKVESAFLQITPDETLRSRIPDRQFFHEFVRSMFFHRRKYLRSELLSAFKDRLDKPEVDQVLARLGIDPTARAEQLGVENLLELGEAMRAAVHG